MLRLSRLSVRSLFILLLASIAPILSVADADDQAAVLLKNDQVISGEAHQEGDRIVIEQSGGGIIRLPIDRVACWGPNMQALYEYRIDMRSDRPDARAHLRDARWCINNGLPAEAAMELIHSRRLSPRSSEADRLEQRLRRLKNNVQPASAEIEIDPPAEPEQKYVSVSATQQFTRIIQPILLNRCGSCHDTTRNRKFSLVRLPGVSRVSATITSRNLQSTTQWIDTSDPLSSPLLEFAARGHGGVAQPPLGKSQATALENLRIWVLQFEQSERVATAPIPTSATLSPFDQQRRASPSDPEPSNPARRKPVPLSPIEGRTPMRLPAPMDPFDPNVFNRQHHRK